MVCWSKIRTTSSASRRSRAATSSPTSMAPPVAASPTTGSAAAPRSARWIHRCRQALATVPKKSHARRSNRGRSFVCFSALVRPEDPDAPPRQTDSQPEAPALKAGLDRLMAAVEKPPLRYAPFYGRLATLWDLSEPAVEAALERAGRNDAFQPLALPGVRRLLVNGGPRLGDAMAALLHLSPGARFPRHRHEGHELVLVLEGSYQDGGRTFEPGDLQEMPPGSRHGLRVDEGSACVAAVVSRGFAFTSLPLRLVQLVASSRR